MVCVGAQRAAPLHKPQRFPTESNRGAGGLTCGDFFGGKNPVGNRSRGFEPRNLPLNGCHLRVCAGTRFPHAPRSGGVCGVCGFAAYTLSLIKKIRRAAALQSPATARTCSLPSRKEEKHLLQPFSPLLPLYGCHPQWVSPHCKLRLQTGRKRTTVRASPLQSRGKRQRAFFAVRKQHTKQVPPPPLSCSPSQ